ncbi:MAG TPA: TolC family protein [Thermoanaerobaculia bacterium]|nr:TolC family protein [Thermoanaerobaculia bacterium]
MIAVLFFGGALRAVRALPGDQPAAAAPYEPPALTFPGDRIELIEAVRLTLQNNPNIKLQEQQALFEKGVAQQATGQFDLTLTGALTYSYLQSALTKSEIDAEQKRRDDINTLITNATQAKQDATDLVNQYQSVLADPTKNTLSDPLRQAEISLVNTLIEDSSDPAVKAQYENVRTQIINREIDVNQQAVAAAQKSIAENEQKLANLGAIPRDQHRANGALSLDLSQPLRNGMTLGLLMLGDYSSDRYNGKSKLFDYGGLGIEDVYDYSIGFSVDAALLRNRGVEATGAPEKAAKINYDASYLAYQQSISNSVLATIQAYWNLASAQEQLEIARESYALQTRRVEVTRALIAGDELAPSEISRVLASQASDQGLVLGAERAVNDARVALAIAMGLSVVQQANAPLAADKLPESTQQTALEQATTPPLITLALARRDDLKAATKLEEAGGVLLRAAQINVAPLLNFHGDVGGGAVAETALARTSKGWAGPSYHLGFNLNAPIQNNVARGQLLQADATWKQQAISRADLERTIKADVVQDLRSLKDASGQVAETRRSVDYYTSTIATENEKFRLGESTLIDTILTQQLQTSALFAYVAARQQYANLIAQLRFDTGTLFAQGPDGSVIHLQDLESLPPADEQGARQP